MNSDSSLNEQQERLFKCIEEFNLDVSNLSEELDQEVRQSADWLIAPPKPSSSGEHSSTRQPAITTFSREDLDPLQKACLDQFAVADTLAIHFQEDTYNALRTIACIIPAVVFFFGVYSSVTADLLVITGYLAAMAGAYGIYYRSKQRRNQEKFLDYRALAEGLRVHFFWKLAGLEVSVASYYLSKQQSELDWIRHAIRNWDLLTIATDKVEQSIHPEALQAVMVYWIHGQADYFRKAASRQKKQMESKESISKWCFRLAMFGLTPAMLIIHGSKFGGEKYDQWLQVATPVAFVIAGAINYYCEKMLFSSQVKQYVRMGTLFDKARNLLENVPYDACRSRDIILKLGKEALAENGDWVLMHRERPIKVPQG